MNMIHEELAGLRLRDLDAGQVFSGRKSGTVIKGYAQPSTYTPAIDPGYIFHEASRDLVVWFLDPKEPLYVFGPTGCGKTSCIKQLAARLNYPVFEVTGHGRLEFADLAGHLSVRDGNMVFEYGPLALAMRYGGLFLFNEIDLTSPEVAAGLNGILDGSPLCIAENGGELISPHPQFRFAATANTNGGGDETGLYQGTQRQNLAFADRFMLCELGYPAADVEERLLRERYTSLPQTLCATMVRFANEVRKLFMGQGGGSFGSSIEVTFSTRSLLRWADLTLRFQALARQGIQPVTYALDRALAYRASPETRAMLHELTQRMFPQHGAEQPEEEGNPAHSDSLTGEEGVRFLTTRLAGVPHDKEVCLYLRKTTATAEGSRSKDWVGSVVPEGLRIAFGRAHAVNQSRFFAGDKCRDHDPRKELQLRADKKLREGYVILENLSNL